MVKRRLLLVLLGAFFSCKADFMLLTLPSSGSEFFTQCMRDVYGCGRKSDKEKQHPSFMMRGEYFRVSWNKHPEEIFRQWSNEELEQWYVIFKRDYSATKEIHAYMQVPFWLKKFDCVFLFRSREYTFPSGYDMKEFMYLKIYQGFMKQENVNASLKKVQKYCREHIYTNEEKVCAAHSIAWYVQLRNYQNSTDQEPIIIDYVDLMTFNKDQLYEELWSKLPSYIERIEPIVEKVIERRYLPLLERKQKYKDLNVEESCQGLLSYMKQLDPRFKWWRLLDLDK